MKIRKSLKLYLLVVGTLSVSILTLFSSSLSVHYFLLGMDTELRNTMTLAAEIPNVEDGKPARYQEFYISSRWQDLPLSIRNDFEHAPKEEFVLQRKLVGYSLLDQPQSGTYALTLINTEGKRRYVAKHFPSLQPQRLCHQDHININQFALIGAVILLMFMASLTTFLLVLIKPIEQFKQWAVSISRGEKSIPKSHFRFYELENVANIIEKNIREAEQSLKNRQEYLDFTSHEMRTPLTVIRNNTEMLKLWQRLSDTKRNEIVNRLERAALQLTNLTETMLWLSCSSFSSLEMSETNISTLVHDAVEDNRYLLNGKDVKVDIRLDDYNITTYQDLLKIVIDNLIRNALQHTLQGNIIIRQNRDIITIKNLKAPENDNTKSRGFGLGLKLVDRVINFTRWELVNIDNENCRVTTLTLLVSK